MYYVQCSIFLKIQFKKKTEIFHFIMDPLPIISWKNQRLSNREFLSYVHLYILQCLKLRHVASICVLPISRFLWALTDAYRTVPRKPAAPRGGLTSPDALVYWRARPKSWKSNFIVIVINCSFWFFTHFTWKANDPEFFHFSSSEAIITITLKFRTLESTKK